MSQEETPMEKALSGIKTAFWATIILVVINGGIRFFAISEGELSAEEIITILADPVIILALAFWLYKGKSRTASILLLLLFLLGKLSLFLPFLEAELTPEQQSSLAKVAARQLIWIAIFGYAYLQGILGTFRYHRYKKSQTEAAG